MTGAARTAIGAHGGAQREASATQLAVTAMHAALEAAGVPGEALGGVVLGAPAARAPDDLALEIAAAAAVRAPEAAPVLSVHRHEATGLQALVSGADLARSSGGAPVLVAASECSSRTPLLVPGLRFHARDDESQVVDALNAARLDPRIDGHAILRDEASADAAGIGREAQDAWALRSHERAAEGAKDDEGVRADLTMEHLASLPPLFKTDGNVTGGNWSPPADGAAALVIAPADAAGPREGAARLVSTASSAGAAGAALAALERAGAGPNDVAVAEVHESSAAHVLAVTAELGLDPELVNAAGGAVATGSPAAAAAAIMVVRALAELERRGGGLGLVAASGLGGQGVAVVLKSG